MRKIIDSLRNQKHQDSTRLTYYKIWRKFNEFVDKAGFYTTNLGGEG